MIAGRMIFFLSLHYLFNIMNNKGKKRVLVAMSGGIDSSVTAMLLKEQGYDIVGITMKTWDYATACSTKKQIGCCNLDAIQDAREVAAKYDFPYMVLDIREEFGHQVINHFTDEYLKGRTPNPCVLCNTHIKWAALLRRADKLGCDYIATGHYAQVRKESERYVLYKGKDVRKDQSYALWGVSQRCLSRTMLPLGHMTKDVIRKLATARGFDNLVKKSESYEICFIPDNNYRGFLKKRVKGLEERVKGGDFILEDGTVVGKHEGYPFYTVGQRRGLHLSLGHPVYVTEIRPDSNQVVVGGLDELSRDGMYVHQLNMVKYPMIKTPMDAVVKVRYGGEGTAAVITQEEGRMKVFFGKGVHAIAPGQAAVFYEGEDVIGGGWIASSFDQHTHGKA